MGNVCSSKHGKGTVKTQRKRWKMVHLSRTLTVKGVCRTGSCSEWVREWVSAEWAWRPRNLMQCCVVLRHYNVTRQWEFSAPLQSYRTVAVYAGLHSLKRHYAAHDCSGILIFHWIKSFLFFLTHTYHLDPCPSCATIQHFNISVVI